MSQIIIARRRSEQNQAWIDPYTAVHTAVGLAFGLVGIRFGPSIITAIVYDGLEQLLERSEVGQKFFKTSGPETIGNVVVDILSFAVGWKLGQLWNSTGDAVTETAEARQENPPTRQARAPKRKVAKRTAPSSRPATKRRPLHPDASL